MGLDVKMEKNVIKKKKRWGFVGIPTVRTHRDPIWESCGKILVAVTITTLRERVSSVLASFRGATHLAPKDLIFFFECCVVCVRVSVAVVKKSKWNLLIMGNWL